MTLSANFYMAVIVEYSGSCPSPMLKRQIVIRLSPGLQAIYLRVSPVKERSISCFRRASQTPSRACCTIEVGERTGFGLRRQFALLDRTVKAGFESLHRNLV
jgi:hypothetical protein